MRTVRIRLTKSVIGRKAVQRLWVKSLGLKRLNSETVVEDTPAIRGLLLRLKHCVTVLDN